MLTISEFIKHHYRHFNAAALVDAAEAYNKLLATGGKMFVTIGGAMSTAELGLSLAEMIRQEKIHGICCTGANLEEDVFNLVAHDFYERVPHYRDLTPADEAKLLSRHMNRVTDTCIPEMEAMRRIENEVLKEWVRADQAGERFFPHQFMYKILLSGDLKKSYQIDPKNSWLLAAAEKNLPIFVPGWEDSTLGNMFAGHCISGDVKNVHTVRTGIEYMMELAEWYTKTTAETPLGFFQIAGGIAGDFPICVVPMLHQDLQREHVPLWAYFCQISRLHHQLWLLLRRRPQRKNHLGQAGRNHPQIHHRVRRLHRSPANLRLRPGLVTSNAPAPIGRRHPDAARSEGEGFAVAFRQALTHHGTRSPRDRGELDCRPPGRGLLRAIRATRADSSPEIMLKAES